MTYRLLRDNKESGPFSEEEMIAKGFKPYDLIWVEGKSAGWRYPSEIPVFKSFAPVVEEQPYDRFYKKQPPQKLFSEERHTHNSYTPYQAKSNDAYYAQQPAMPSTRVAPLPDYTAPPSVHKLPGRHIHVTLPSGNTVNLSTLAARREYNPPKDSVAIHKIPATDDTKQTGFSEPIYQTARLVTADPVQTDTAAPLGTGYNMQPVYGRQPVTGWSWSLVAAACIGIATMVGLGIMIGLSINRDKHDRAFNEALSVKSGVTQPQAGSNAKQKIPANTADETTTAANETLSSNTPAGKEQVQKDLVQNAVIKRAIVPDNNELKEIKKLLEEKAASQKAAPLTTRDEPVLRIKTSPVLINVEKNLSLTLNDFKTGAFGGISGLKCTLFNGSKYPLESVEAEVDYVQANNKVYKTEKILFRDIAAGAQATADAPASSRGVKITTRIIKVNPKETPLANTTAKS